MIYRNHAGDKPVVDPTATIHPSAVEIGNVQIGEKVFVGPNAFIRADEPCPEGKVEAIIIESEVNIQDGVIIHALGGSPVHIGSGVSLAHGAVIHDPCHGGCPKTGRNDLLVDIGRFVNTALLNPCVL